ncbi:FkbM family methyltransferase [Spirosoma sp. KUDC1026]|uniref:FkbM family methyltransferase n=1 Tax=Spirosoma sp. KUDC1026 TaxID=2745947 RepID=UPI00159BD790|nr:FkbM family methyltransferase [Spirosoma sp. KUDC1026]QKZ12976.1 FkbM family methyltransferase [Spirosoma sp. KUDC1026]
MKKRLVKAVRSVFTPLGVYLAPNYPNIVNGHKLEDDLRILLPEANPLCFDIGANRGQTIELLQDCLNEPSIHSFEPASTTYAELLSKSFGPRVQCHQLALGEQVGTAEFRNYKVSELSSFLPMNPDKNENFFAEEELMSVESVPVDTLDNFCSVQAIDRIDLLKIDTQGFELPVLHGAAELFKQGKIGAVLLELNFATLYEGQSDPLVILQLLRSYQMRLVDYYETERINGKEISWTTALFIHYPNR